MNRHSLFVIAAKAVIQFSFNPEFRLALATASSAGMTANFGAKFGDTTLAQSSSLLRNRFLQAAQKDLRGEAREDR